MSFRVTSSWDDGHVLDLRVAELLNRYQLKGTFYIARDYLPDRMSPSQIRELAQTHEIGAHTMTHPVLTNISIEEAGQEIIGSKQWLEDIIGQEVTSFCYPKGYHNAALQELVREAGFKMARSVEQYRTSIGENQYTIPTTLQIYPYPLRPLPDIAFYRGWRLRLRPLIQAWHHRNGFPLSVFQNWQNWVLAWVQKAHREHSVFHFWGHSWEIEQYQSWNQLESLLKILQDFSEYRAVTNSELVE